MVVYSFAVYIYSFSIKQKRRSLDCERRLKRVFDISFPFLARLHVPHKGVCCLEYL